MMSFVKASEIMPMAGKAAWAFALALEKGCIRAYQVTLSPLIGNQCRFHPTCSNYALAALDLHGPVRGAWLAARRLLKCHPLHPGGVDLPPPRLDSEP